MLGAPGQLFLVLGLLPHEPDEAMSLPPVTVGVKGGDPFHQSGATTRASVWFGSEVTERTGVCLIWINLQADIWMRNKSEVLKSTNISPQVVCSSS